MKSYFDAVERKYDGAQLASLFAYQCYGVLGDSVVAWVGPCDITRHMVDAEDERADERICGDRMLHFICEIFHEPLSFGVAWQRLMTSLMVECLVDLKPELRGLLSRTGDDIYVLSQSGDAPRKLSISIATTSSHSTLIHFAINVVNLGTPVPTAALEEWNLVPSEVAEFFMGRVTREFLSLREATCKVHGVGSYRLYRSDL